MRAARLAWLVVLPVAGVLTLSSTTVLDLARLGTEEEDEPGQATDRTYWITRGSASSVGLTDELLALVNEIAPGMALKYNKYYIGLARDGVADNFITFRARRERLGHHSSAFTMDTYAHVIEGLQAQAATAFAGLLDG